MWRVHIALRWMLLTLFMTSQQLADGLNPLLFPIDLCSWRSTKAEKGEMKNGKRQLLNEGLEKRKGTIVRSPIDITYIVGRNLVYEGKSLVVNYSFPSYLIFPLVTQPSFAHLSFIDVLNKFSPIRTLTLHIDLSTTTVLPSLHSLPIEQIVLNVYNSPVSQIPEFIKLWMYTTTNMGMCTSLRMMSVSLMEEVTGCTGLVPIHQPPFYRRL